MQLPKKSCLIENIVRSTDERGSIVSVVDEVVNNVSIITCNAGAIRSNHYSYTDWHLMYVLEGQIDYFFKAIDSDEVGYICVKEGDNIFTPAMEIHTTYFPVKTTLIVSSKNPRDQESYEKDTVRVVFIDEKNIEEYLEKFS